MVTIRPEQFAAMAAAREAEFLQALVRRLRESLTGVARLPEEEAVARAGAAMAAAQALGLRQENTIASFVRLAFIVGDRFFEHPRVRSFLEGAVSPDRRFSQLVMAFTPADWRAIRIDARKERDGVALR